LAGARTRRVLKTDKRGALPGVVSVDVLLDPLIYYLPSFFVENKLAPRPPSLRSNDLVWNQTIFVFVLEKNDIRDGRLGFTSGDVVGVVV
jgi:hypothetical protein